MSNEPSSSCTPHDRCPICRGALVEKRLKKFCTVCGVLCETCCDNGQPEEEA